MQKKNYTKHSGPGSQGKEQGKLTRLGPLRKAVPNFWVQRLKEMALLILLKILAQNFAFL
jgi:hypothetical protein